MIEDLDRPFVAVATEINTGHEVWITDGSLITAHPRLLCAARHFRAGRLQRPHAGRRRAGQSGAGLRLPRL